MRFSKTRPVLRTGHWLLRGAFVFAALLLPSPALAAPASSPNLVHNGGFEQGMEGWAWMVNSAQASGALDTQVKHSGLQSFRMTNASGFAPNVFGRVYQTINGLRPYTTYRISAWVKGKGVGGAWVGGGPGWGLRQHFPQGDFDWRQVSIDYDTGPAAGDFELMILMESQTTALWVDDVAMKEVGADVVKRAAAEREMQTTLDDEIKHLARVQQQLAAHPALRRDRYIMLGVAIARRFLARVQLPSSALRQSEAWSQLQVEEVKEVLDATDRRIQHASHQSVSHASANDVPEPLPGKVTIHNGVFESDVAHASHPLKKKKQPYYFGGYGHFGQVLADLPNFPALGASLIQEDPGGPAFFINPDGALTKNAHSFVDTLKRAAKDRMKLDLLISLHYFPPWVVKQAPDVMNGGGSIPFNIDHPAARDMIQKYLKALAPLLKNEPALFSFCLSNEPTYSASGRDRYSRPLWVDYLRQRHGTIAALNALYGTHYDSFDKVPVPAVGMPAEIHAQRAYWDWVRFNQKHFAAWHHWLSQLLKAGAPNIPTHAKIMVFYTFDRGMLHLGVDPELFCDATDIAGCDAYAFPTGGDEVYNWQADELWYDLLHSFNDQPVFNSENHIIPDNSAPNHFPPEITRAAIWQGGLHHQGATTIWVWEEEGPGGLNGSVYFRPANIYSVGRALLDLNRLSPEVTAINQSQPDIALLYSMPSIFWEPDYGGSVSRLYTALRYSGLRSTFVSERQLQSGHYAKVKWIIVPHATHVESGTVEALQAFVRHGGRLIFAGDNDLGWNEYHQPRTLPAAFNQAAPLDLKLPDQALAAALRGLLPHGEALSILEDVATGQPAWHVEYQVVNEGQITLIPMINYSTKAQTVRLLPAPGGYPKPTAVDLLTGEKVDLNRITLDSIVPRLLQVTTLGP